MTHAIFVALAVPSTLAALSGAYRRVPWMWALHNTCIAIMAVGTLAFGRCPLVELEDRLRTAADEPMPYTGSFVHYLLRSISGWELPAGSMLYISSSITILTLVALILHRSTRESPVSIPVAVDWDSPT
jgi:hypothetical protein